MIDNWIHTLTDLPPDHLIVATKIHDQYSCRHEQMLYMAGRFWYHPDGTYVYTTPTHWRRLGHPSPVTESGPD